MEAKTKVNAEQGKQDLTITREFDLPLDLLFKAYSEPELVAQWMETNVLKFENRKHGSYQFEKKHQGNVVFRANGVIHEFIPNQKIIRTFEIETASFGVQLEIHQFEKINDNTSKISIHTIFETVEVRDQMLKLPFAQGINTAHNRLQEIATNLK